MATHTSTGVNADIYLRINNMNLALQHTNNMSNWHNFGAVIVNKNDIISVFTSANNLDYTEFNFMGCQ